MINLYRLNIDQLVSYLYRVSFIVIVSSVLTGCLRNDVDLITNLELPGNDRAVIVVGIGKDDPSHTGNIFATFEEYSIEREGITGNCWVYNKAEASINNSTPKEFRYFAFSVAPGYYVSDQAIVYEAPKGKVVYFGDFIYTMHGIEFRNNIDSANTFVKSIFPEFRGQIELAKSTKAKKPIIMFLCAP